jgi:hypothetical protein
MLGLIRLVLGLLRDLSRSRAALEAEVLVLRQQIIVLRGAWQASVTISVIALSRPEMTREGLEDQLLQAARDVLSAGTLDLEEPIYEDMIDPPMHSVCPSQRAANLGSLRRHTHRR